MFDLIDAELPTRGHLAFHVGSPNVLSDEVIPAVPGEFYAYSATFTPDRPIYALMKCKAKKDRAISALLDLGGEANLFLKFNLGKVEVFPVKIAQAAGLLGDVKHQGTCDETETWIARVDLADGEFHKLYSQKNIEALLKMSQVANVRREDSITLAVGMTIAVATPHGKHGLFLVQELTSTMVRVEACHILL
tara:strand:- start:1753 stop:2328 length:576 start_codon:yes stop_codon:yes gene_type:complete